MRFFFFVILLCNIIFFLWEFNSRPVTRAMDMAESTGQQILLLSELPKKEVSETADAVGSETKFELADGNLSDFKIDDFKPAYKKFVLDNSIDPLTLNFDSFQMVVAGGDDSDKYIADYMNSLDLETLGSESSEAELNPQQNDIKKTEQKQGQQEEGFCYQVGPFLNEKLLIDWVKLNNIDEDGLTRFNKKLKIVSNYLVYYPRAESYALSKENIQMIKNKGIKDWWLFKGGELKGVISLGLLKKKARALFLQKKLAEKGLNAEIMPRYKTQSVWYAKIVSKEIMSQESISISEKQSLSICDNI